MIVTIKTIGLGTVVGSGEYSEGETVSLSATPDSSMLFKNWNGTIGQNPYLFISGSEDQLFTATFYMPIELMLKNLVGYPLTDDQIYAVLIKNGIEPKSDPSDLSNRSKDLAYADLLMLIIAMPSFGAEEDQMGNWKHKGKSISVTGKSNLVQIAKGIYAKYGVSISNNRIIDITNKW